MGIPASTVSLDAAVNQLGIATMLKNTAQSRLVDLQNTSVSSDWAFSFLDQMRSFIAALNAISAVSGINAAATSQIPGYAGTLTTDIATTVSAINTCITWVFQNFPKDSTNTWLLSHQLNADGTRTPRTFAPSVTTALQNDLNTLISTIS